MNKLKFKHRKTETDRQPNPTTVPSLCMRAEGNYVSVQLCTVPVQSSATCAYLGKDRPQLDYEKWE